jgi:hypothetical protein
MCDGSSMVVHVGIYRHSEIDMVTELTVCSPGCSHSFIVMDVMPILSERQSK